MSAEVPPISKVITFKQPLSLAKWVAAITPAAGHESAAAIGNREISCACAKPPLERRIWKVAVIPRERKLASIFSWYSESNGISAVFRQVVLVRSYSRYSRRISEEIEMRHSGYTC